MVRKSRPVAAVDVAPVTSHLSKCALAVPPVKKTGNAQVDFEEETDRQSMVDTIELLLKHPQFRGKTEKYVRGLIRREAIELEEGDSFFTAVSTMAKIDEAWMSAFITAHSKLSKDDLAKVKRKDTDGVRFLFYYLINAAPSAKVPAACRKKRIMCEACRQRASNCGDRLKNAEMNEGGTKIQPDGTVQWGAIGAYALEFNKEGTHVARILHRATGDFSVIPEGYVITDKYSLLHNWSDSGAMLVWQLNKYKVADFFDKPKGPHKVKTLTGKADDFGSLVEEATKKVEKAEEKVSEGQLEEDEETLRSGVKESQREQSKRAREAMAKAALEKEKKRRISVKTAQIHGDA